MEIRSYKGTTMKTSRNRVFSSILESIIEARIALFAGLLAGCFPL